MRGLAQSSAALAAPDLQQAVGASLDRRLLTRSERPVAVALSGGGDSLALLLASRRWAERVGRRLVVLTVDHGLRAGSADWTRACAATAARLDLPFRALHWVGDKPETGLPAAARVARHRLLAGAAREAGARVVLLGHTADDRFEARQMRATGSTTPEPRAWSPSPVWPEGRGIFLLRPLLDLRRAAIRDWLRGLDERWIDDPANEDLAYARPRARQALAMGAHPGAHDPQTRNAAALAAACTEDLSGGFAIGRATLRTQTSAAVQHFLSVASVCAAGTTRPPQSARVVALAARLTGVDVFTATLAGARIEAGDACVRIVREAGEAARGGLASIQLATGQTGIWDGRFEVQAMGPVIVEARRKASRRPDDRAALRALTPAARAAVPVVTGPATSTALTYDRMVAACGLVQSEPGGSDPG